MTQLWTTQILLGYLTTKVCKKLFHFFVGIFCQLFLSMGLQVTDLQRLIAVCKSPAGAPQKMNENNTTNRW